MSGAIKAARGTAYGHAMPGTGYMGDPGLFGWIGKKIKGAAGFALGLAGQAGVPFAGEIGQKFFAPRRPRRQPLPMQPMPVMPVLQPSPKRKNWGNKPMPRPIAPPMPMPFAGPNGGAPRGGDAGPSFVPAEGCPVGTHPNKTGYWVTSSLGTPSYVGIGERCVKNRKRNPLNPRATDRAISRLKSAKRAAQTLGRITIREKC